MFGHVVSSVLFSVDIGRWQPRVSWSWFSGNKFLGTALSFWGLIFEIRVSSAFLNYSLKALKLLFDSGCVSSYSEKRKCIDYTRREWVLSHSILAFPVGDSPVRFSISGAVAECVLQQGCWSRIRRGKNDGKILGLLQGSQSLGHHYNLEGLLKHRLLSTPWWLLFQ